MNDDISRLEAAITELEQQLAQAADPTLQAILRTRIAEKHQALRQHTGQPAAPPSGTSTTIHGGVTGVVLSGTFEGPVNVQTPDDSAWRYTLLRDLAKHYGAPLNDDADAATLDAEDARLAAQIPRLDEVQQHAILIIVRLYSKRRIMGGVWGGRSPSTSRVCEPRAMRHWDAGRRQSAPPPVPVGADRRVGPTVGNDCVPHPPAKKKLDAHGVWGGRSPSQNRTIFSMLTLPASRKLNAYQLRSAPSLSFPEACAAWQCISVEMR